MVHTISLAAGWPRADRPYCGEGIWQARMPCFSKYLLVVILGAVKFRRRDDLRHDGPLEDARFSKRGLRLARRGLLLASWKKIAERYCAP